MDKKIRVGAVSYLNTKPLIYGFEHGAMQEEIDLYFDYPAKIAAMLINDEIDIGLIPVAAIPKLPEYHIITSYCIGASAPVASVCLFSDVPLDQVQEILLDYQSRTSAALLELLLKDHWKIKPVQTATAAGFEEMIHGNTAGLIIGDRALKHRARSQYIYDLAGAWLEYTGLPFVFAAWVANKKFPATCIQRFNAATALGLQHFSDIAKANPFPEYDLLTYYNSNIDYRLDAKKVEAMNLFLKLIRK